MSAKAKRTPYSLAGEHDNELPPLWEGSIKDTHARTFVYWKAWARGMQVEVLLLYWDDVHKFGRECLGLGSLRLTGLVEAEYDRDTSRQSSTYRRRSSSHGGYHFASGYMAPIVPHEALFDIVEVYQSRGPSLIGGHI